MNQIRNVFTNIHMLDDLTDDDQQWLETLVAVRVKGVKPKPKTKRRRRKSRIETTNNQ